MYSLISFYFISYVVSIHPNLYQYFISYAVSKHLIYNSPISLILLVLYLSIRYYISILILISYIYNILVRVCAHARLL